MESYRPPSWLVALFLLLAATAAAQTEPNTKFDIIPRPTDEKDFPEYIQYLVDVAEPRTVQERAADGM
jgi:hypothetical protein